MLKWIGSILILIAGGGIGFSKSYDMEKHLEELEELKKLFYLLRSELQYSRIPFAEVFEKMVPKTVEPYQAWLQYLYQSLNEKRTGSFWKIWSQSIEEKLKHSRLKKQEMEELQNVGKNLEYMESFDLYIEQLEHRIKNTREEYRSKRKLCQSMGIMGGIFLVIILL